MTDPPIPASDTDPEAALDLRPLTARSLLASMLLGSHPPALPVHALVAAAELFGITDNAARTALSRMVRAGDLTSGNGWYELGPELQERQRVQDRARAEETLDWDHTWRIAVSTSDRRSAQERAATRRTLADARYGELREGVWIRPANLATQPDVEALSRHGWVFSHGPLRPAPAPARLWDLDGWAAGARALHDAVTPLTPRLDGGDRSALAQGFVLAAAGLRHFRADPLLPRELLPQGWPAQAFRTAYDRFDGAYRALLGAVFRETRG